MDKPNTISIEEMAEMLAKYGNEMLWQMIEKLNNPLQRLAYRQLFFMVGGTLDK